MKHSSQDTLLAPFAVLFTALPYVVAFYHNEQLCEKDPVACVAYEGRYNLPQQNFDLNGAFEQGITQLEQLIQTYTQ